MPTPLVLPTPQALSQWVGKELAVTDWFELTQDRIRQFAEATDDRQWIHVDRERAKKESPFGAPIAHGYFTLSMLPVLLSGLMHVDGVTMGINYGTNKVRFPSPVPVGSEIRAGATLAGVEARPSIRATGRDVPPELEAICVKATALSPEERFASARELYEAVERYLDGDRDIELRQALAKGHAKAALAAKDRAISAIGEGRDQARQEALGQVGRALALDPTNDDALRVAPR